MLVKKNENGLDVRLPWKEALQRALARADGSLDALADSVVKQAQMGSPWAIEEIANRLDGKPKPQLPDVDDAGKAAGLNLAINL
ncbi:MAG: hypothetical protein E6Q97_07565 [Desulfurellales bacterium]|nr:MAG: hypothetical protein E6Q97_07565 [Desulfurellales bacterium]